jgi:hypothetical protein
MNIKKSVRSYKNPEHYKKVKQAQADFNVWIRLGAMIVTGLVIWGLFGVLNIPIVVEVILAAFTFCSVFYIVDTLLKGRKVDLIRLGAMILAGLVTWGLFRVLNIPIVIEVILAAFTFCSVFYIVDNLLKGQKVDWIGLGAISIRLGAMIVTGLVIWSLLGVPNIPGTFKKLLAAFIIFIVFYNVELLLKVLKGD